MAKDSKHPDPKLHKQISFLKSTIRIAGYCILPTNILIGAVVLVLSEVIGIIEEMV
jgi:hypothetical protein